MATFWRIIMEENKEITKSIDGVFIRISNSKSWVELIITRRELDKIIEAGEYPNILKTQFTKLRDGLC